MALRAFSMKTPDRTTAEVFSRYTAGEVLADSAAPHWPGLFVRHWRFSRVVECFLVPATPEPRIVCQLVGTAVFVERDLGEQWTERHLMRQRCSGHIVNFSSIGGLCAFAATRYYHATKFAVKVLSIEMAPLDIKVTIVEPGPFRTD